VDNKAKIGKWEENKVQASQLHKKEKELE